MEAKNGRPRIKEGQRNFCFRKDVNDFLTSEAERQGRALTVIVERTLLHLRSLKPAQRDEICSKAA